MMRASIALVTTPTRLRGLVARWGTKGAARFHMGQMVQHENARHKRNDKTSLSFAESTDVDFDEYELEDQQYQKTLEQLRKEIEIGLPVTLVEKRYLANFDFRNVLMVIVMGHDGLVANTAKYANGLPIVGVNPDPARNDGLLTPFATRGLKGVINRVISGHSQLRQVSLAEASLNDGQSMLAFNDFFIGKRSHTSARYTIDYRGDSEPQSSSGIIVATGAGSTGWLSSVFNMTKGVSKWTGGQSGKSLQLAWEDRRLAWVVREPFASKHSKADMVAGTIDESEELVVKSLMPDSGVIFSDGIEEDYMEFNSGSTVRLRLAQMRATLVVPSSYRL